MLKKKKQYEYISKRCDNILNCVNNFCAHKDHEELHKLRVEIKKLKAYAAFTSKLTGQNLEKKLEPFTDIFRKAGEVRTAHLNLETIKKFGIRSPGFKKSQQAVIENVTAQFTSSSQRYIGNIEKACNSIQHECHDISEKKILKFYEKKIDSLSVFFNQNFDEKKLHSRRKIIKMLLYADNLLSPKLKRELALNTSYFDVLQDTAGKWHDVVVINDMLNSAQINNNKLDRLMKDKDGLLQAVKSLATHFDKNLSLKKTIYAGP
jgi:CHAD domain-containing protein